ncbi:MAG TPA: menaquinone biosynthesis protein [Saprospiraceae bacterium]|nr:menaquinone biosynthesis protein [Saprospiraceae bacterium]
MKIKTAIVSYHNTLPFLHAIHRSSLKDKLDLILAAPSQCASLFSTNQVDIALVPVGALSEMEEYEFLSDTCIGCNGEVYTVAIFSNQPLESCDQIYLDSDSRTSNELARIILEDFMGLDLELKGKMVLPLEIQTNSAYVLIGDKVFEYEKSFKYKYDLGQLWKEYTGLPFAFAVWIVRKNVNKEMIKETESILNHLDITAIENKVIAADITLHQYLTEYISYNFDEAKREALAKFLSLQKSIGKRVKSMV